MIAKYLIATLVVASTQTIAAEAIRLSEVKQLSFRTNKTEYQPGDSILIHYWVINPDTQQPETIDGGVTFQLLSSHGEEISSIRSLPTVKGSTAFVQAPYSKGVHYLRAYTDEMLNISDKLIPCTPLYVNAVKSDFSPFPNKEITVTPEGGTLVPDQHQRIVISAPYYIGDSVFVYNKAKKLQTESVVSEYGNTMIMFTPEANETYTIQIQDKQIPLEVVSDAITLQLTQNRDKIIYTALSDKPITKTSNIKLEIYTGSELIHSSNINDSNANGYFDTSKLPNTILSFVLTQNDSVRIAQRAVFTDNIGHVSQLSIDKNILKDNNVLKATGSGSNKIDPEQSYRVQINTFDPLFTDMLPAMAKLEPQYRDFFDASLPAAKRHYVLDLHMIQLSALLATDHNEVYPQGYSNTLRGKVKKEVVGSVNEGKIIAINSQNRNLAEAPLSKGGIFDINLGAFSDSTSFYLQAYNKKEKSNFFVIEIDSIYKPGFTPTHGKIKQTYKAYTAYTNIKDITFEDVIPEIKVTAQKKERPVESETFYEGRLYSAEKIQERSYSTLEQIIEDMSGVTIKLGLDADEKIVKYAVTTRGLSILQEGYVPIVTIMVDNIYMDFMEANNLLDVNTFEKIEYIPASRAAIYGPKAFNGLIKIDTKSGWKMKEVPSQGIKFYPKGFCMKTEQASWRKKGNQCIVVTGKELLEGTNLTASDDLKSIFIEGFDRAGNIIQQRIVLND